MLNSSRTLIPIEIKICTENIERSRNVKPTPYINHSKFPLFVLTIKMGKTKPLSIHMKYPFFYFFLFFFYGTIFLNAQQPNDSLAKYSYEELHALIDSTKFDKQELSKQYAEEYLRRAKLDNDKIKVSRGYFYITHYFYLTNDYKKVVKYSDSIIQICSKCKHKKYPALGYYFKAAALSNIGKDRAALDFYLIALNFAQKTKNVQLEIDLRREIIGLKSNWGNNEDVLKFYLEDLKFIKQQVNFKKKYKKDYLLVLYNLSVEYLQNKQYQESLLISNEGIRESLIYKDTVNYYDFIFLSSAAQYHLKKYKIVLDSLLKIPFRNEYGEAINNYYLGKSYDKLNQPEKAQFHFLKTDSIYQATKDIFPEMRNVYEHIITYYKSKNDVENQIKYYDRLLEADKIIDSTYTYVTETVDKKFDTPEAIAERARLVEEAKAKESSWKFGFGIISVISLGISGLLIYIFRRQRYYKQRFEKLMNIEQRQNVQKTDSKVLETNIKQNRNAFKAGSEALEEKKDIGISETIVENILKELTKFEKSKRYTKQVTLTELAKEIGTNPKYLSKVINWHYQKNFTTYINELRVEYVIFKLKEDSKFRNYTIKAIAKEAGFGNAESFSKTFYKFTGIYPSYFIKQLHKRLEN